MENQPSFQTAGPGLAILEPAPAALTAVTADVQVNNPDQDLRSNQDLSTQSEPSVAAFDRIVVVAFNDSGQLPFPPFPPISLTGYSRSVNGGSTFMDIGALPPPPGGLVLGDPGLVADRVGTFYASSLVSSPALPPGFQSTMGVFRSTDGGLTWPVLALVPPGSTSAGGFIDKPLIAVDNSTGRFSGNVYVSYTNFLPPSPFAPQSAPIFVSRSVNRGLSLTPPVMVSVPGEVNQGSEPAVGPGGEVYVAWLRIGPGVPGIMVARSTDGGATFAPPVFAAAVTPIGFATSTLNGGFRANSFPRIDVNPANGHVYIVYASNPPGADGSDAFLIRSTDGGATWSAPLRINDDMTINDQFFPDIAIDRRGVGQVIWYDRRNDPENRLIEVFQAQITLTGTVQGGNTRLSSIPFPVAIAYDPTINPTYMGDYLDNKVVVRFDGPGVGFVDAWGDNRRRLTTAGGVRNDQDVFFKRVDPGP